MDEARLKEIIEEATIDCHDEYEQYSGMEIMLAEQIEYPFKARAMGDIVEVQDISQKSGLREGILVDVEKNGKVYAYPILELEIDSADDNTKARIAAYKMWANY